MYFSLLTTQEANLCKAAGIQIIAIGVGNYVNHYELQAISSYPNTYFTVDSFSALALLLMQLCPIVSTRKSFYILIKWLSFYSKEVFIIWYNPHTSLRYSKFDILLDLILTRFIYSNENEISLVTKNYILFPKCEMLRNYWKCFEN